MIGLRASRFTRAPNSSIRQLKGIGIVPKSTTRFMGNAAYLDIATGEITSIWNVRAACSNNLFPANGILNAPNLTGGCTCNYLPISQGFVNAPVVERLAGRQ
jgi:hypothetical protein